MFESELSEIGMYKCFSVYSSSRASLSALDPLDIDSSELPIWLWSGDAVRDCSPKGSRDTRRDVLSARSSGGTFPSL